MRWIITLTLAACLAAAHAGQARAERSLKIATEGAYPPFNYADQNNEPTGFEVDLGRALCAAMKVSCTFVLQDWDGMISALKTGRVDAIMSSMEITPERARKIAFSDRYYRIPSALIGRKGVEFTGDTPEKLAGKTIGTTVDSEFQAFLETGYRNSTIKTYDKLEEAELDLLTERIDLVLGDKLELSKFLTSREGAACCQFLADMPVDRGDGIGVGLRKSDTDLLALFNKAIAQVKADGTYDRIEKAYFSFDIK